MAWESSSITAYTRRLMDVIYYKDISDEHLQLLGGKFKVVEYLNDNTSLSDASLFLLGAERTNLIRTVQDITKKDPDLGVLIVPLNQDLTQLKVAIQFAPFMSKNVKIIDFQNAGQFVELVQNESALTLSRRKFRMIKSKSASHTLSLFEQDIDLKAKFFDKLIAQAPVGVVLLNHNSIVLDVNKYVSELLGNDTKIITKYFPDIFIDKEAAEQLLQGNSLTEGRNTLSIQCADGNIIHTQLHTSDVNNSDNAFKIVVILDATRQVEAEKVKHDYLERLENQNKELEQFAYVLSHDLKNPLSTIKLSCEMASEQSVEDKSHFIEVISRSANNLLHMIEGLEEMIDVRKNTKQIATEIHFLEVLNNVLNEYHYQIKNEQVQITADFKKVESIVYVESYLTSFFHNLISNSIKYRKNNEPLKITISTSKVDRYTLLKISDNGIGIDLNKNQQNLFKPFTRFTNQASGKGIGLSIVKSMIEKNNGKIEVESAIGEGTTFYCYLCPYT